MSSGLLPSQNNPFQDLLTVAGERYERLLEERDQADVCLKAALDRELSLEREKEIAQSQLAELSAHLTKANQEKAQVAFQLENAIKEFAQSADEDRIKARREHEELKSRILGSVRAIGAAERDRDALKAMLEQSRSETAAARAQLLSAQNELAKERERAAAEHKNAEAQNEKIKTIFAEKREMESRLQAVAVEEKIKAAKIRQLEISFARERLKHESASQALILENQSLKSSGKELIDQVTLSKAETDGVRSRLKISESDFKSLSVKFETLRERLENVDREKSLLETRLTEAQLEISRRIDPVRLEAAQNEVSIERERAEAFEAQLKSVRSHNEDQIIQLKAKVETLVAQDLRMTQVRQEELSLINKNHEVALESEVRKRAALEKLMTQTQHDSQWSLDEQSRVIAKLKESKQKLEIELKQYVQITRALVKSLDELTLLAKTQAVGPGLGAAIDDVAKRASLFLSLSTD